MNNRNGSPAPIVAAAATDNASYQYMQYTATIVVNGIIEVFIPVR